MHRGWRGDEGGAEASVAEAGSACWEDHGGEGGVRCWGGSGDGGVDPMMATWMAWGGEWGGGARRGDGICALGRITEERESSVVGADPMIAAWMAWGGGWGRGVCRGDRICALGRTADERGAEPCTTEMWTPTLLS